ncbi:MAG: hypothetical protein HUJ66_00150, partial [Oscillospiraceae bacterium]|nr:hypothetical protein [Oscillospiraceae bacterium]
VMNNRFEPTCTENGWEEYWSCDVCNKLFSDEGGNNEISTPVVIPAKGHSYGNASYEWAEDFTCAASAKCLYCDDIISEISEGDSVSYADTVEATCTEHGTRVYTAGFENPLFNAPPTNTVDTELKAHSTVRTDRVEPSCTKNGWEEYWTCSVCYQQFSDSEGKNTISGPQYIDLLKHTMTAHSELHARCMETGTKAYWSCDVCTKLFADEDGNNEIYDPVVIPATGHTLVWFKEKAADCNNPGTEEYWRCSGCDRYFADANGTAPIDGPTVIPITHTIPDVTYFCGDGVYRASGLCTGCNMTIEEESEDFTVGPWTYDPCETGILTIVVDGKFNNPCFKSGENTIIDNVGAIGTHVWDTPEFDWADDCSYAVARSTCINGAIPAHTLEQTLTPIPHPSVTPQNPSCEYEGYEYYLVEITLVVDYDNSSNEPISQKFMDVEAKTIPALGHEFGEISYVWNEDYTACTAHVECQRCGPIEETALAESFTVSPTCGEDGAKCVRAVFDLPYFEEQVKELDIIPATGSHVGLDPVYTYFYVPDDAALSLAGGYYIVGTVNCSVCGKLVASAQVEAHLSEAGDAVVGNFNGFNYFSGVITLPLKAVTAE